jgi:glycosyltransferase involved in cell wall biosynthesis
MRILFANATRDWGGEKSWALELAACLQGRGHACAMAGRHGDPWVEACAAAGLESHGLRFGPGIFNPLGIRNLHRIARRHHPGCIVVNISRDMCAGAVVGALLGLPVIRHVGLAEDLNHDPVDWILHKHCLAGTIAVGHQMKREMLDEYPWLEPDNVAVIHIGKDPACFRPGPEDELRRVWGLSEDALIVGVTSQLEEKKGHTLLLDALARLDTRRLHLAVVGRGAHESALRRRVRALGLCEQVHFLGFSRDLPRLLRSFDFFALPSLSEGFPNTLVEAMATGLACIATDLACIPEILVHGQNGLLVRPGDPAELASALSALMADASLRRSLGEAARACVVEHFDLEGSADRFVAHVTKIAGSRTRCPRPVRGS